MPEGLEVRRRGLRRRGLRRRGQTSPFLLPGGQQLRQQVR
jgi:hypothetical protein